MSAHWDYHDGAHLIPVDRQAERSAAGLAVVSGEQARLIAEATRPESFHDHQLHEIVLIAAQLPLDIIDGDVEWAAAGQQADHRLVVLGAQARANALVAITGIEMSYLVKLAVERSTIRFTAGLAERLDQAALARLENSRLVERLASLGVNVGWLTNLDARLHTIAGALLRAATGLGALINGDGPEAEVIDALLDAGLYVGVGRDEIAAAVLAATEGGQP